MQFQGFNWLSGDGIWVIIRVPCPRNSNHSNKLSSGLFLQSEISKIQQYLAIFPLVGYEMIVANSMLHAS